MFNKESLEKKKEKVKIHPGSKIKYFDIPKGHRASIVSLKVYTYHHVLIKEPSGLTLNYQRLIFGIERGFFHLVCE